MKKKFQKEIKFQDENAENYALKRETDFIWEIPEQLFLIEKKYFKKDYVIIDMGCGPCVSIKNILSAEILSNCRYIGIDISKNMLSYAKRHIPKGKFIEGNIENLNFKKNSANVILSLGALHHCEDKLKTIKKWINILKKNGIILLREPTYEAMPKGSGESPLEEGIKVQDLLEFLKTQNIKIISLTFFSSPAFHLFNRIMIRIGLGHWQKNRKLWYLIVFTDVFIGKLFSSKIGFFKGYAFTMKIKKI